MTSDALNSLIFSGPECSFNEDYVNGISSSHRKANAMQDAGNEISKSTIKDAYLDGTIELVQRSNGVMCKIGVGAFFFAGEDGEMDLESFLASFTQDDIVGLVYTVLKNRKEADGNGIHEDEYDYYKGLLEHYA